jgi:hypothetical protein
MRLEINFRVLELVYIFILVTLVAVSRPLKRKPLANYFDNRLNLRPRVRTRTRACCRRMTDEERE